MSDLTGQAIIIRNHGDGNSFPSSGVTVTIPARRDAPKAEVDSKAQTVSSDKEVEFSADGGKARKPCPNPLDVSDLSRKDTTLAAVTAYPAILSQ